MQDRLCSRAAPRMRRHGQTLPAAGERAYQAAGSWNDMSFARVSGHAQDGSSRMGRQSATRLRRFGWTALGLALALGTAAASPDESPAKAPSRSTRDPFVPPFLYFDDPGSVANSVADVVLMPGVPREVVVAYVPAVIHVD